MFKADASVTRSALAAFFAAFCSSALLLAVMLLMMENGIGSGSNLTIAIMSALYLLLFFPLFFLLFRQRSELEKVEKEIKEGMLLDETTRLYKSSVFEELADTQIKIARRNKWPVGLVVMDIDGLSSINESFGYESGNMVLKHFSSILKSSVRESDLLARYDDDRFLLLLPDCDTKNALKVMQRIQATVLESPLESGESERINIPFSSGVVSFSGRVAKLATIMGRADEALERAKRNGANRIEVF